ncbi:MAG: ArsR family transcriptional regulator [Acidimicrobiia bacterium]|nr:ArsR family transcriptional regulator [Acidimicrobiia bacterium]
MDADVTTPSATQRRVLEAVKRAGEATADELAETLNISTSAVRQHLSALRSAGFVVARQERGQTGRPADRYHATPMTEQLFAGAGGDLAVDLLGHVAEEDPNLIDRIFQRRRQHLVEAARHELHDLPLAEKVAVLTKRLDAQGYLADFEQVADDHYRINLHNCGIWSIARRYPQACAAELEYVNDLLPEATVQRTTHKTAGSHTCGYEITIRA